MNKITDYWFCTPGQTGSAFQITRKPSDDEYQHLAEMDLHPCKLGATYRYNVECPVNGDGYYYQRQWLLDCHGNTVGSVRVPGGYFGEI